MAPRYDELLIHIKQRLAEFELDRWFVIGIDGNCGSGKSTLAQMLSVAFSCAIIQVDDFFLPTELRTDERLAEVAGNFHYERFLEEVLSGIPARAIAYRKFDCQFMDYTGEIKVKLDRVLIIEGSYAFSHGFSQYYDYRIFTRCSEQVQLDRIRERVGEAMFGQFIEKWIPLENRYFLGEHPETKADFVLDTDDGLI